MLATRVFLVLSALWSSASAQVIVAPIAARPAASFSLEQVAGPSIRGVAANPVTAESLSGHVVLLEVWWSTCLPCPAVHTAVAKAAPAYADSGVIVLSLTVDRDSTAIATWLRTQGGNVMPTFRYPLRSNLGLRATPTIFLLDRRGRIAATAAGNAIQLSGLPGLMSTLLHESD